MTLKNIFILFFSLSCGVLYSQSESDKQKYILSNNQYYATAFSKPTLGIQLTAYCFFHGGSGFSLASGLSFKNSAWQASMNTAVNCFFGLSNMGNSGKSPNSGLKKNPNKVLLTVTFSPMMTFNLGRSYYAFYEELNPMYFGNSTAIGNNYLNALTVGTTFITTPKGKNSNMMTPRNRSQQLLYLQVKSGFFLLNVVEDYLIITETLQFLADNRDRYYTGAGNIQFRVNNFYKIKFYTETYTGTSYPDYQDYPDIGSPSWSPYLRPQKNKRREKYAYQDPGQKEWNNSRNFFAIEIPLSAKNPISDRIEGFSNYQFYWGWGGGFVNGIQQHLIHNAVKINRNISLKDKRKDQLHHFDYKTPPHDAGRIIFGAGFVSNFYKLQ